MQSALSFDVIIIGASSSGLMAAENLAKAGKHVGIFERAKVMRPARRTYIVTSRVFDYSPDLPEEAIVNSIDIMAIRSKASETRICFEKPDLVVERNQLIKSLSLRAQSAGAKLFMGYQFVGLNPYKNSTKIVLATDQRTYEAEASTLLGADGAFSSVGAVAGIELPKHVAVLQAEIPLPAGVNPHIATVWLVPGETPFFYWLIPESSSRAVVGLITHPNQNIRKLLDRFLIGHNFNALAYQAAKVASYHPSLKPWGKVGSLPVMLIGDAAGQVKMTTVGGTVTGLWGAQAAVDAVLSKRPYKIKIRKLNRELITHWLIHAILENSNEKDFQEIVLAINSKIKTLLQQRNRDSLAGVILNFLILQPRLLWFAKKIFSLNHLQNLIVALYRFVGFG